MRRLRDERGGAAVEFAIVAMLFFVLVFGIFDFSRLLQGWVTVQHAAREAARYATTGRSSCTGVTDDREACIVRVAEHSTSGLNGGGVDGSRVDVDFASADYPDFLSMVDGQAGNQCDEVEVDVHYNFEFALPPLQQLAPSGIMLNGTQRTLNEPWGPCEP
jgi:Flp pilus assembly pilin Flp